MGDLVTIGIETPRIKCGCSLEKEFTKLICMNPLMILYQLSIRLIHVTLFMWSFDLRHQKRSCEWMAMFLQ